MVIKNAKYMQDPTDNPKVNISIFANIDGVDSYIPLKDGNIHYAEILKQVKEGTLTIADAD